MCWMWLSAVFAEMNSRSEISRVVAPSAISRSTCVSRAVRPAGAAVLAGGRRARGGRGRSGGGRTPRRRGGPSRAPAAANRSAASSPSCVVEPLAEVGERRARGGSWPARWAIAPSRVRGDAGTVEPLEQGRQAGQRDDQLGHGAGAQEGLDRRAEQGQRRLQLAVRGVQQGGVAGQEALEEPDVVLAEVAPRPRPRSPARAAGPPSSRPARRSTACRPASRGCRARAPPRAPARVSSSASSTRPADCSPSTYAAIAVRPAAARQRRDLAGSARRSGPGSRSRPVRAPR